MKTAVSRSSQHHDQNCEVQLRELREYVARRGWAPAIEFVDAGVSGAKASPRALDRLMGAAARREFDCVMVWKIDRFGRSVLHLSQQLAALTSYGVRFMSVSQAIDTDASNPSSRLCSRSSRALRSSSARLSASERFPAFAQRRPTERCSEDRGAFFAVTKLSGFATRAA